MSQRMQSIALLDYLFIVAPGLLLVEVAGAIARRTHNSELGHKALAHILSTPGLRLVDQDEALSLAAANLAAEVIFRDFGNLPVRWQQFQIWKYPWHTETATDNWNQFWAEIEHIFLQQKPQTGTFGGLGH